MYFILVRENATGKIVEKVDIGLKKIPDKKHLKEIMDKVIKVRKLDLESKYPPDKYQIISGVAESFDGFFEKHPEYSDSIKFRMQASVGSLIIVNVSAIILGAILGFVLLLIRILFHPLLYLLLVVILIIYFSIDFIKWIINGIRIVETDEGGINLYRGKQKRLVRINANDITEVNVFKKLNRRIVTILTGGKSEKTSPGVKVFQGPKTRIADDTFNNREFSIFIEKVRQFNKP